ncbi:acyl-coenzyme A thioesterase 11 isoform X2 [Scyliorhinus torazame]
MMAETKESQLLEESLFIWKTGDVYTNPTEVKMSQLILPCHANHRGELSTGQLLKWMDTTACLSAERHANCPCVTVSVDDIDFEHTLSIGQVVNIKAKVNRAFNTSLEVGIAITCEDPSSGMQWKVCNAFATFVAKGKGVGKVQLKPMVPGTSEEQMEHSIAAERRRMRLRHLETIKALVSSSTIQNEPNSEEYQSAVPAGKTRVESIELVLPPHANHQGNTFGGQIMAWMESVAAISASRFCKGHPVLKTIDMFHFRGPSNVGDRISLKAIVNNAFKTSFEVGVCAEAYHQEVWDRKTHINSAFLTFVMLGKDGELSTLPCIKPEPGDGERRYREASARKKIRLDRKFELIQKVDEDDVIYHVIGPTHSKGSNFQDFVLLASRRVPCADGDPYLIALRSVSLPAAPPTEDLVRSEVLCAGFTLWEEEDAQTRITYYIQATPGILPYITCNITGLSADLCKIIEACHKFLEQNKDMTNVAL